MERAAGRRGSRVRPLGRGRREGARQTHSRTHRPTEGGREGGAEVKAGQCDGGAEEEGRRRRKTG